MPSPEDRVTISQIAEATGIKRKIVAGWVETRHLKPRGKMKRVGQTGGPCLWFRWKDVEAALVRYVPGGTRQQDRLEKMPAGYTTREDAAYTLRTNYDMVSKYASQGEIKSVRVRMNGVGGKCYVFYEVASIDDFCVRRGIQANSPASARPLISSSNDECLKARRELWEKRRNCVDSAQEGG